MQESIIELIKQKKLNKINKSITASETNENYIHNKAEAVKAKLVSDECDSPIETANLLAYYYYTLKAHRVGGWKGHASHTDKSRKYWTRVQECCAKADCTPEHYIKAQFAYFEKVFGACPQLSQLTTDAAILRAVEYAGSVGGIRAKSVAHIADVATLYKLCDAQVREACAVRKITREEYYRQFVLSGLIPMNKKFLESDPSYQRALTQ